VLRYNQADPAPGEDTESTGHGYHPKAPDLDKQYDDELSEIRPVSSSVVNNQACHAYRRRFRFGSSYSDFSW